MNQTKSILVSLSLLVAASLTQTVVNSQSEKSTSSSVESGKIRFYETHEIRGEENYQITQSPNGDLTLEVKTDLPFAGDEKKPLVNATLRTARDLTPQSFAIKGSTMLEIEEDTSVTVENKTALEMDKLLVEQLDLEQNSFAFFHHV